MSPDGRPVAPPPPLLDVNLAQHGGQAEDFRLSSPSHQSPLSPRRSALTCSIRPRVADSRRGEASPAQSQPSETRSEEGSSDDHKLAESDKKSRSCTPNSDCCQDEQHSGDGVSDHNAASGRIAIPEGEFGGPDDAIRVRHDDENSSWCEVSVGGLSVDAIVSRVCSFLTQHQSGPWFRQHDSLLEVVLDTPSLGHHSAPLVFTITIRAATKTAEDDYASIHVRRKMGDTKHFAAFVHEFVEHAATVFARPTRHQETA